MAGDWIKMRINLDSDPRVISIAAQLGTPELHVVGMLWKVWSWADSHSLDGNALCVTDVTLDRFVDWTGFAAALRNIGWLTGRDNALSFPRFAEHNGQTAKKRGETQLRVAKHRGKNGNANSVTDVTQKTLPEKRREEVLDTKVSNTPLPPSGDVPEKKPRVSQADLVAAIPIPPILDIPKFHHAWARWQKYRREKRSPLTPTMAESQLSTFATWGVEQAIAAIEFTILKGWQGIRRQDESDKGPQGDLFAGQKSWLERRQQNGPDIPDR